MQRDFVLPGGFGEALGNDTSLLLAAVDPIQRPDSRPGDRNVRRPHARVTVRPQRPSPAKLTGGKTFIGEDGPMGCILSAASRGHDIIHQLLSDRRRARDRQAGQGQLPRDRPQADPGRPRHQDLGWSAGSLSRSASTPPSGKPTTAATSAWSLRLRRLLLPRVPAGRTGDDQGPGAPSSAGSPESASRPQRPSNAAREYTEYQLFGSTPISTRTGVP